MIRKATLADVPALQALIGVSARTLSAGYYEAAQVEAALLGAFGVDTTLIRDGTYFICVEDERASACGGWSRRATAFGGDSYSAREARELDPASEAARIRAFFVHPDRARRGLASQLLALCEAEAGAAGFTRSELTATLPGEPFYRRHGYTPAPRRSYALPGGIDITFVPMHKSLT